MVAIHSGGRRDWPLKCAVLILVATLVLAGCRTSQSVGNDDQSGSEKASAVSYSGKIALVRKARKYVVIEGGRQAAPPPGTVLEVYRAEQWVGELEVTGQARASTYAADIVQGTVRVGDLAYGVGVSTASN